MPNIIRNINESIAKLRKLLSEETPVAAKRKAYDTDKNREYNAKRAKKSQVESPSDAVSRGLASANAYADRLGASHKIKANNVIINTLLRGIAGAVDATFIKDLDTRWTGKERVSMDSNDTNAFDYIIQMLAVAYNMTEGQTINVGGQEIPITSDTREKVYNGFLKMFDIRDMAGRWRYFIFGSAQYSLVDSRYRPKVSTRPDGTLNFEEINDYLDTLNQEVRTGLLAHILKQGGFYDKGFAYFLDVMRRRYISMLSKENQKGNRATNDHPYDGPPLPLSDPRMQGLVKTKTMKSTDTTMDISDVGRRDNGENPGHTSQKHFINALRSNIKGKSDLDANDLTMYTMADYVVENACKFVQEKFGEAPRSQNGYPVIPELFRAHITREPESLQYICLNEKYKEIYPNVYAAYFGKTKTAPAMAYINWEKKYYASVVAPAIEQITKQYIDEMDLDTEEPKVPIKKDNDNNDIAAIDFGGRSIGKDKDVEKEKLAYNDYQDPTRQVKRINPRTKEREKFVDYDDYFNSLEENEGEEGKKKEMLDAVMKTFAQLAAPR